MCLLATILDSTTQLVAFEEKKKAGRVREKKEDLRSQMKILRDPSLVLGK